jgi:lysophospholipase L1-like esterase
MSHVRLLSLIALLLASWAGDRVVAQPTEGSDLRIEWEVKNRFRLFRTEADFLRHVAAHRGDGIRAAEERLERANDGRGWARDMVERLCVDRSGALMETCVRDGDKEIYLSPRDHRVGVKVRGRVPSNTTCFWTFSDGDGPPQEARFPCGEEVKLRVRYGRTTLASVDVVLPDDTAQRVVADIAVRDLLMAGMGDSIAAGEGNPDRPIALSDSGFCFRRFLGGVRSEYYRPGRAGFTGNKSCVLATGDVAAAGDWARQSARWMSAACHRSLYSYQIRTALALAIEQPHVAVTFIPLGCTGATIDEGFLAGQRVRECPQPGTNASCPGSTRSQIAELTAALSLAQKHRKDRQLDLVLLTIGANDIYFAGLIANIIVESTTERVLLNRGGHIAEVSEADGVLNAELPRNFVRLRAALKPLVGGDLARVVYVSYGDPALVAPGQPCPGGHDGFDVHPGFTVDSKKLRETSEFVSRRFLPGIRILASCENPRLCKDPKTDRMTFVDSHQSAFAQRGFCVKSPDDPVFDRRCFSPKGESFRADPAEAASDPMTCDLPASEYRPYAPRGRWIRTANDSYFTAMTYPEGMPVALQPTDIHDATWGIYSAVLGGAVHPTAEGHAVMADAALPAVRGVLGLRPPNAVRVEKLPPLNLTVPRSPAVLR